MSGTRSSILEALHCQREGHIAEAAGFEEEMQDNPAYKRLDKACKKCGYRLVDAHWRQSEFGKRLVFEVEARDKSYPKIEYTGDGFTARVRIPEPIRDAKSLSRLQRAVGDATELLEYLEGGNLEDLPVERIGGV